MTTDPFSPAAGHLSRMLGAAAHLSAQSTRRLLADLSLTEESLAALNALRRTGTPAPALAEAARLTAGQTTLALESLRQAGYARPGSGTAWSRTSAGEEVLRKLGELKEACQARAGEAELRQALFRIIQSMDKDAGSA